MRVLIALSLGAVLGFSQPGDLRADTMATNQDTVHLAFVLGGGVSLGTFEAGAVAEIVRQLELHNTDSTRTGPKYIIDVLAGASAGSMMLAILARDMYFFESKEGWGEEEWKKYVEGDNNFYKAWVEGIDISHLLPEPDSMRVDFGNGGILFSNRQIKGLANTLITAKGNDTPLLTAAGDTILFKPRKPDTLSIAGDSLMLAMTLANREGIQQKIEFSGKDTTGKKVTFYTDKRVFRVQDYGNKIWVQDDKDGKILSEVKLDWDAVGETAIASGSFPFAFPTRKLLRYRGEVPSASMEYTYVDGGFFNNNPFELATELARQIDGKSKTRTKRQFIYLSYRDKKEEGFSFGVDDISDWSDFIKKIHKDRSGQSASLSEEIWDRLPADTQSGIAAKELAVEDTSKVIEVLDGFLDQRDFYEQYYFAQNFKGKIKDSENIGELLQRERAYLPPNDIRKLNRLLIELAYEDDLKQSKSGAMSQWAGYISDIAGMALGAASSTDNLLYLGTVEKQQDQIENLLSMLYGMKERGDDEGAETLLKTIKYISDNDISIGSLRLDYLAKLSTITDRAAVDALTIDSVSSKDLVGELEKRLPAIADVAAATATDFEKMMKWLLDGKAKDEKQKIYPLLYIALFDFLEYEPPSRYVIIANDSDDLLGGRNFSHFGGFFNRHIREYDYNLGRYYAQKILRDDLDLDIVDALKEKDREAFVYTFQYYMKGKTPAQIETIEDHIPNLKDRQRLRERMDRRAELMAENTPIPLRWIMLEAVDLALDGSVYRTPKTAYFHLHKGVATRGYYQIGLHYSPWNHLRRKMDSGFPQAGKGIKHWLNQTVTTESYFVANVSVYEPKRLELGIVQAIPFPVPRIPSRVKIKPEFGRAIWDEDEDEGFFSALTLHWTYFDIRASWNSPGEILRSRPDVWSVGLSFAIDKP